MNLHRILSLLFSLVYTAILMLVVLPHGDIESAFGSGKTSLAAHADAANCKHIDASHAETCPVCLLLAGRALFVSSPFVLENSTEQTFIQSSIFSPSHFFLDLTSFSRRAPPVPLTIA